MMDSKLQTRRKVQMKAFKIGVLADSFRLPIREGILKAREAGAEGIQIYATTGQMAPENLDAAKRRELLDFIESNGMAVSALCGDLGGHGFMDAKDNPGRIERSKRIMELAVELKTTVVTTHIGVVPEDPETGTWETLWNACNRLAEFGDTIGASFAIETGPEKAATLKKFLDSLTARGVRVNMDPANLVMVAGDDASQATECLAPYIVHTHAKDGIMLQSFDPAAFYSGQMGADEAGQCFREVPLGEGSVDFPRYLKTLQNIGYSGFLTIEREVGEDPEKDIRAAVAFLKDQISRL
jgi:L-ribulose-5-phosphate 3-epimerase